MAEANNNQKSTADKAQDQFDAKKTQEAEVAAVAAKADEARATAQADDKQAGLVHGIPKDEFDKMNLGQQKRVEMGDPNSPLRNQETKQDEVDFQLLSATNAYTIEAMTGVSLADLKKRADELGIGLKGSAAGDMPQAQGR